jgi:hypothetical protein
MTEKIPYTELLRRMHDPAVPESQLRPYLMASPTSSPLDPVVVPNPATVEVNEVEMDAASAIRIGNGLARWRRQRLFNIRRMAGEKMPVLISEGDSWFQFPFLIEDVIDHLGDRYLVWSLDAAGDTAKNMVDLHPEYMEGLRRFPNEVRAFLFSAAGNDVIGQDENGASSLFKILKPYSAGASASALIDRDQLRVVLADLSDAYTKLIRTIRAEPGLARLPIIIHGYDYPFAYPFAQSGNEDPRSPIYAARDEWLGSAFTARGIADQALRREVLKILIDTLYRTLAAIAGDSDQTLVFVVDCRGALPQLADWADEIHGNDAGFADVADRFHAVLKQALASSASI